MQDDACTHMICPECQTCWCYFCGLKEIDCDKDEQIESTVESGPAINRHNIDWENNPKRLVYQRKREGLLNKFCLVVQCI